MVASMAILLASCGKDKLQDVYVRASCYDCIVTIEVEGVEKYRYDLRDSRVDKRIPALPGRTSAIAMPRSFSDVPTVVQIEVDGEVVTEGSTIPVDTLERLEVFIIRQ